jgi:hypothetical protein
MPRALKYPPPPVEEIKARWVPMPPERMPYATRALAKLLGDGATDQERRWARELEQAGLDALAANAAGAHADESAERRSA